MPIMTSKDLRLLRDVRQLKLWLEGKRDRRLNKGCLSANGRYLEGWYSSQWQRMPDFLTNERFCRAVSMLTACTGPISKILREEV